MLDWLIVVAFVVYSCYVGWRARHRASRDLNEYFLAGRRLRGWQAGMSMAATQFAADTPLLVMGLLAVGGIFSLWRLWIYGLAFLLMGFVLGAAWRRAGVLTDAELTMIRYSARGALTLRTLKAVYYGTVINCVVMAFVLAAAMRIFELFLPWHEWLDPSLYAWLKTLITSTGLQLASGVTALPDAIATTNNVISLVLMLAFVGMYSTAGGLRGVVSTDVMQLILMLAGTAIYAWLAVDRAGGLAGLPGALTAAYGDETAGQFLSLAPPLHQIWPGFVAIIGLQWFYQMNSDGTGYLAQRTMACEDDRQARIAAIVFTLVQIVLRSVLWLLIGIALLVIFPFDATQPVTDGLIAEREIVFARGIDMLLPIGARGLLLTALLAALASTLDTHLNWGASYWSNDLYKGLWLERIRRRPARERELVLVARLANLGILLIALTVMTQLGSIQRAWQLSLLFGAGMGAVLVLRWVWERINLYCEILAIAVSLLLAPVLLLNVDTEWARLVIMAAVSTGVVIAAALWMPGTETARLVVFYRQVRPPGWWNRTAQAAGIEIAESHRDLRRDVLAWLSCALSTYLWLIGTTMLLLRPDMRVAGSMLLVGGTLLVPVWVRAGRLTDSGTKPDNRCQHNGGN